MSTERKPQEPEGQPRREKQNMTEPQEEFVGDEAQPSKDVSEVRPNPGPRPGPERK